MFAFVGLLLLGCLSCTEAKGDSKDEVSLNELACCELVDKLFMNK